MALPGLTLSAGDLPAIRATFFDSYRLRFGRTLEESPIEVLSWRLSCRAPGRDIRFGGAPQVRSGLAVARRDTRNVLFEGYGWLACAVFDRYALPGGVRFPGPALVEERESTCVVGPGASAVVDEFRNLIVELGD